MQHKECSHSADGPENVQYLPRVLYKAINELNDM